MNSHSGKHPPVKKGYCLFFHCGPEQQVAYQQKDKGHDPDNTQIPFLFKKTEYVEESKKQKRQKIKKRFLVGKTPPSYGLGNHIS